MVIQSLLQKKAEACQVLILVLILARCWQCCDSQELEVSKQTPELSDLVMLLS